MTGFNRTGKLFAYEHWNVEADIVALSKGMGAGYFPLGAVMARREIVDEVVSKGDLPMDLRMQGIPWPARLGSKGFPLPPSSKRIYQGMRPGLKKYKRKGLEGLAETYDIIGQVTGRGVLLGVGLVRDRKR